MIAMSKLRWAKVWYANPESVHAVWLPFDLVPTPACDGVLANYGRKKIGGLCIVIHTIVAATLDLNQTHPKFFEVYHILYEKGWKSDYYIVSIIILKSYLQDIFKITSHSVDCKSGQHMKAVACANRKLSSPASTSVPTGLTAWHDRSDRSFRDRRENLDPPVREGLHRS